MEHLNAFVLEKVGEGVDSNRYLVVGSNIMCKQYSPKKGMGVGNFGRKEDQQTLLERYYRKTYLLYQAFEKNANPADQKVMLEGVEVVLVWHFVPQGDILVWESDHFVSLGQQYIHASRVNDVYPESGDMHEDSPRNILRKALVKLRVWIRVNIGFDTPTGLENCRIRFEGDVLHIYITDIANMICSI